VRKLIKHHDIDIVCVYNTPIFPTVWFATWKLKTPIILVMLEYYPALLSTLRKGFLSRIKNPSFVCRFVDNLSTKYADYVIVMADELKERILKNGKRSQKIEIVSNYHQIDKEIHIDHGLLKKYENRFVLSYIGLVNASHRGVDIPIHAMPHIIKNIPEALLLIVGSGRALPEMRELTCELKLQDYVEFTDWVPFHLVPTYISASTVGLIPYRIDDHTDTTLPHKLFQYMAIGKPVVASRARAIARIISQTKCGYVVPPEDPTTLSKTVISLYENKAGAIEMGRNGARWVADKYNWEAEFLKLNQIYLSFRRNSDKISALNKTP
jgi:glycosyltransferase involved in cell wall biosynthesis